MNRKLSVALFVSVGFNLFLAGALSVHWLETSRADSPLGAQLPAAASATPESATERVGRYAGPRGANPQRPLRDQGRAASPDRRGASSSPTKRAIRKQAPVGAPVELLRDMVRVMGGPKDARVTQVRQDGKAESRRFRAALKAAHKRVATALKADPFEAAALKAALAELNSTRGDAQVYAQGKLIKLAQQMTPAERKLLRTRAKGAKGARSSTKPHEAPVRRNGPPRTRAAVPNRPRSGP